MFLIAMTILAHQEVRCATDLFYQQQLQASKMQKTWGKSPKAGPAEGDTVLLWVEDLSVMPPDWKQINFVCMRVTENAYIMVDAAALDSGYVNSATVDSIATAFEDSSSGVWPDTGIFVIDTSAFGPPPDELDNDPRVYLVYYILEGYMGYQFDGYFNFADEYPDSIAWNQWGMHSNERECIYLDCHNESPATPRMLGVLAHEFQHMLHWRGDNDEVPWVNEGCSELAMFLYGEPDPIVQFNTNPDNSLVSWSTGFSDYVKTYLWSLYLFEQFDSSFAFTRALVDEDDNSVFGVDQTLAGVGSDMTTAFYQWVMANYLDDTTIEGGIYGYKGEELPAFVGRVHSTYPVGPFTGTVKLWASDYIKFRNASSGLQFTFDGQDGKHFFIRAMLFDSSGPTQVVDISPGNSQQDTSVFFPDVGSQFYQAVISIAAYPEPLSGDSSACTYTYWADQTDVAETHPGQRLQFRSVKPGEINLILPEKTRISLDVYDASGRLVSRLFHGHLESGEHTFAFNPSAKGVYLAVLGVHGETRTLKLLY